MSATVIDGKLTAKSLRQHIKHEIDELGITPGLAVILVGNDPASQVYVGNKIRACEEVGITSTEHHLPESTLAPEIAALIKTLNKDPSVNGILLQLPLPDHLAETQERLVQMIASEKDVDGLTFANAGKLFLGHEDGLVPCTPQGALHLIHTVEKDLSGKDALIIGRSNLFGKPMAQLLLRENCTVTTAHSRTRNLETLCKQSDIVIAAVGRAEMVKGEWIKPGAIIIDVGINRGDDGKLKGDVDYAECSQIAEAITPVPGGVGPMTIACLLQNTLKAYKNQHS